MLQRDLCGWWSSSLRLLKMAQQEGFKTAVLKNQVEAGRGGFLSKPNVVRLVRAEPIRIQNDILRGVVIATTPLPLLRDRGGPFYENMRVSGFSWYMYVEMNMEPGIICKGEALQRILARFPLRKPKTEICAVA